MTGFVGGLLWLGGMLLGLYELVFWLKNGYWASHTLAWVFGPYFPKDWSGATQIFVWLWDQPLWTVLAVPGTVLVFLGIATER